MVFKEPLPEIPIILTDVKTYLGQLRYTRKRLPDGTFRYSDFLFRFNTRYDLKTEEWEDIILHEMIHYCIAYNQINDSSPHGKIFRKMMKAINQRFNRNITIRYRQNLT
ncbi:MAG: SprT-like domain-containing protein [Muribaculaceae bacterium]|nr:SprT-like domain-containing protein [Muribaculaceae bacterium]